MAWCGRGSAGEKTPFRCLLDAARYTAASMVTVLILVVIVKAMKVILFPDSLYVSVVGGSISVAPSSTRPPKPGMAGPPAILTYLVELRIYNPRRSTARMYFVEVITYLFENDTPASSSRPLDNCFAAYDQDDVAVRPQEQAFYHITFEQDLNAPDSTYPQVVYSLYNNESAGVRGVTMRMDATVVTEELTSSGFRLNSSRKVQYYCWPLVVIRGELSAVHEQLEDDDVFCRMRGTHFIYGPFG